MMSQKTNQLGCTGGGGGVVYNRQQTPTHQSFPALKLTATVVTSESLIWIDLINSSIAQQFFM
jgi:hypothetical protein